MSEPLPSITDEDARMLASAQSFERGVGYFRSSALSTPGVWGTNCASTVTARDTPLTGYRPGWGLTESKMPARRKVGVLQGWVRAKIDFSGDVVFANCRFSQEAEFKYSDFAGSASFQGTTFRRTANFKYTELRDYISPMLRLCLRP